MTTTKRGTTKRRTKHKGLQPRKDALGKRTRKEQVFRGLWGNPTEAGNPIVQPKRKQSCSRIQNPMRNLPRRVDHRSVQAEKEKLTPSGGSIKITKPIGKLKDTMGWRIVLRQ